MKYYTNPDLAVADAEIFFCLHKRPQFVFRNKNERYYIVSAFDATTKDYHHATISASGITINKPIDFNNLKSIQHGDEIQVSTHKGL